MQAWERRKPTRRRSATSRCSFGKGFPSQGSNCSSLRRPRRASPSDASGLESASPGSRSFLYDIEIDGRFRGRGLGREAMLLVEQEARRRGFVEIRLNVFGGNETARSLYRSLQYVEFAIGMRKRLT